MKGVRLVWCEGRGVYVCNKVLAVCGRCGVVGGMRQQSKVGVVRRVWCLMVAGKW